MSLGSSNVEGAKAHQKGPATLKVTDKNEEENMALNNEYAYLIISSDSNSPVITGYKRNIEDSIHAGSDNPQ